MKSRSLCTMSNCRRSVLLVWILSSILACPVISVVEEESIIYTNANRTEKVIAYYCKDVDSLVFPTYRLLVLFCIPAVLMIVFYTAVIRELWKSAKNIRTLTSSSRSLSVDHSISAQATNSDENYYLSVHSGGGRITTNLSNGRLPLNAKCGNEHITHHGSPFHVTFKGKGRPFMTSPTATKRKVKTSKGEDVRKTRKQVIKMLIVVVLLFILCWGPIIITEMLIGLGMQEFTQEFYVFKWVASLLPFIHCCINPLIYCFMSKNFRKSMIAVITKPCRFCKQRCSKNEDYPRRHFSEAAASRMSSSYVHEIATGNTELETISAM